MQATAVQTWQPTYSGSARWCIRLFPSLTDFAFILPAFLLFVILPGSTRLLNDGDTGWHIRAGEWILQHGTVPKTDIFSFTKPHGAWFAWEWGWDVLFGFIHRAWGLAGVTFVNACLLCGISALLFRLIRRCCENDVLSLLFTIIAVCGSMIHWLARPHLVSWFFVLIFLHVLLSVEQGKVKLLWWLPFLTALWTNLHGGFFIGIVMVLISAAGEVCKGVTSPDPLWRSVWSRARQYAVCAIACSAASLANPYTWHLHQHVFSYLRDPKLLDSISEYQSISFHHVGAGFFEGMLLIGAGSVWWCIQRGKFAPALLTILWAHLALFSGRNIPLFVLIASPWAACMIRDLLSGIAWSPRLAKLANGIREACQELSPFERFQRSHALSILAVLVLAMLFASRRPGFQAQFDGKQFPIEAVPDLDRLVKSRIFTYDQWSDYLIYRFPDTKVYMDGRSDFYGWDFVDTYLQVINASYNWQSDLKKFAINTVILKPEAPLVTVLKQSSQWRLLFDNGSVIVFVANAMGNGGQLSASGYLQRSLISRNGEDGLGPRRPERGSDSEFINQERRSL